MTHRPPTAEAGPCKIRCYRDGDRVVLHVEGIGRYRLLPRDATNLGSQLTVHGAAMTMYESLNTEKGNAR